MSAEGSAGVFSMPLLERTGNWMYLIRLQCYKTSAWKM
jgi:hypothetical protein